MQLNIEIIIYLVSGIIVGAVIVSILLISRQKKLQSQNNQLVGEIDTVKSENIEFQTNHKVAEEKYLFLEKSIQQERKDYDNNLLQLKTEISKKDDLFVKLNTELAVKSTDLKNLEKKLSEQKSEIEQIREKFQSEFKILANEIFEEKSKKFTDQNKTNINDILNPLRDKIKDFERKVEETYDKESKQRFSLKEEVKRLAELNQQVSTEASNLTRALKGQAKTQGNWGELILENILEKSGLEKNREYFIQQSFTTAEGKRLQPDVIISYPGKRHVVIDAKVSLVAYERLSSAETMEEQETARKEHLISVKNHIIELSRKNYQDIYQISSFDFVMLFLPVEPAYLAALQADSELWNFAYDRRVLLMSPTNLIAALKLVSGLWQQEYQNRNVQEIAKRSGELYDKFVGLYNDLEEVGKKIEATQIAYKGAMNKLMEGKGNLIRRVEAIKGLGAKTKKNLPDSVVKNAIEEIGE